MTTSPRLGLALPVGSDAMNVGGALLGSNYGLIDAAIGASFATSSPASPYQGRVWYDTTGANQQANIYNGSAWQIAQGANFVKEQTNFDIQAVQQTSTGSDITVLNLVETVTSGLKYLVRYNAFMKWQKSPSGAGPYNYTFKLTFKLNSNSSVLHSRTYGYNSTILGGPALGIDVSGFFEWIPAASGSDGVTMFFKKNVGRSDSDAYINLGTPTYMSIERIRN